MNKKIRVDFSKDWAVVNRKNCDPRDVAREALRLAPYALDPGLDKAQDEWLYEHFALLAQTVLILWSRLDEVEAALANRIVDEASVVCQREKALRERAERAEAENEQLRRRMRPYRNSIDVSGDCLIEGEGEAR